jgi:transposase
VAERKKHPGRYPAEMRERAVRMVLEHQSAYPSQSKAIESNSAKLDVNHETLRIWVRRAEDRRRSSARAHHRRAS